MGKPRYTRHTQKYPKYPEIPDRIFWHSYPTRTRPATRYFVQYPTQPDIEKPYPLGTDQQYWKSRWNTSQYQVKYFAISGEILPK